MEDNQKSKPRYYTPERGRANMRYITREYEQIAIRVRKGKREQYKEAAEYFNMSLAGAITEYMDSLVEQMERDKANGEEKKQ